MLVACSSIISRGTNLLRQERVIIFYRASLQARERKREKKRKNARIKENDNFFWIIFERNEEVIDGSSGRKIIFRISVVVR